MRCPTCGARNPEDAVWCTQCYASFTAPAPPADPYPAAGVDTGTSPDPGSPARADGPEVLADGHPGSGDPSDPAGRAPVTGRDIREVDGQVEWRCAVCGSWMPLEAALCGTCGSARTGFGEPATPVPTAASVPPRTLLGASAVAPGLGHLLAGRTGSGITRLSLWVLWVVGGLWWVLSTQNGRAPGLVLLLGAVILWVATIVDADAIAKDRSAEPFGVRGLLWTVVGVTGLLMVVVALVAAGSLGG